MDLDFSEAIARNRNNPDSIRIGQLSMQYPNDDDFARALGLPCISPEQRMINRRNLGWRENESFGHFLRRTNWACLREGSL